MEAQNDLTSREAVLAIARTRDDTVRNLQITQSYHELALALERYIGPDDLSWPAFATYASKQAGQVIRGDVVPEPLRSLVLPPRLGTMQWLRPTTWLRSKPLIAYLQLTVNDLGRHIAEGNRLVYTRLAPLFADFVELCRAAHPEPPADADFAPFLDAIRAGEGVDEELPSAFEAYRASMRLTGKARAESVLLGNLRIGWHEQQRLQPPIRAALDAPVTRAFEDPKRLLVPRLPIPRFVRRAVATVFRMLFAPVVRHFEEKVHTLITRCFMTLSVPTTELGLGDDIPRLWGGREFPPDLAEIDNEALGALLARLDPTPDTLRGTGARDWADLGQRMHYIADLFRSRQKDRSLLEEPFAPRQAHAIARGEIPPGRL